MASRRPSPGPIEGAVYVVILLALGAWFAHGVYGMVRDFIKTATGFDWGVAAVGGAVCVIFFWYVIWGNGEPTG